MTKTVEEICNIIYQRRLAQSILLQECIKVRDRYNGDWVIPLPNTVDEKPMPAAMPVVIANAIDNTAVRAGSVMPSMFCPALDESIDTGPRSRQMARTRKRALGYTWYSSYWALASRRALRHLSGYMSTAIDVQADLEYGRPCIKVRDPLTTYPEQKAPEDYSPPRDVAYVYGKSREWVLRTYPEAADVVGQARDYNGAQNQMWEVAEWIDEDEIAIVLLGPQWSYLSAVEGNLTRYSRKLRTWNNLAGRCTTYIPRRVTLDRIANQVANMVGVTDLMARLVELDVRATERSIFPDRYITGKVGQSPQLVGGSWKDGATGEVNIIIDADSVGQLHGTPDPHNTQTIDRLERAANLSMGVVPQMGGENYGGLRTGRAMDAILGSSIDPRIQEMHEILQVAMTHTNEVIADVWKGYWPKKKVIGFSGWTSDRGMVDFTPADAFETGANAVLYPIPGADIQTTTVILGQLYGAEAMSMDTFRHKHPLIEDPEGEATQRLIEDVEKMGKAAFAARAQGGGITPAQMGQLQEKLERGLGWVEAIAELEREVQEQQAQLAQMPGQEGAPEYGAAPGAQPGLGNPGEGGQQMAPQIGPPPVSLDNFRQLTRAMKAPNAGIGVHAPGAAAVGP